MPASTSALLPPPTEARPWIDRLGIWLDTESTAGIRRSMRGAPRGPGYDHLELPSCALRYRAHGSGATTFVLAADPPIVLEHYDALVAALAPHGRVVVFELPGFGFSPARHGFDFSFDAMVDAVARLLTHVSATNTVLCFPCASAYVATTLATLRPDLVRSLVLAQAPSFDGALAWARGRDPKGILARPAMGQLAMHALKKKRAPAWFGVAMQASPEQARMQALAADMLARGSRWSLASAFQRSLVDGARLLPVEQPVIALWGAQDRSHAATDHQSSRALGRDVRLVEWSDVGHFPDLEAPTRFAELVRSV